MGTLYYHTADQMRAYGRQCYEAAREDAATIAESFIDPEWPNDDQSVQCVNIACAIRSRK